MEERHGMIEITDKNVTTPSPKITPMEFKKDPNFPYMRFNHLVKLLVYLCSLLHFNCSDNCLKVKTMEHTRTSSIK